MPSGTAPAPPTIARERPPAAPPAEPDDRAYLAALDRIRADLAAGRIRELAIGRVRTRYRLSLADTQRARAVMLREGLVTRRGQRYMARVTVAA